MNPEIGRFVKDYHALLPNYDKKYPTWYRKTFERQGRKNKRKKAKK
ncbi:hypothetical protein [Lysinibacillus fusiformis]|nr:hypothetical protein [Lysinibacillus fusiformis]SCX38341.1 hypothetical protein SAMN02787108_00274 [Lysinibacillus fusiformis]SDB05282.1 hypothetical protein SAMN02787070_00262 [Lysinibacillus fusiformis]SFH74991.1 hypothetical protein SAMN02787080_00261 [Lysinibacillus fusiformis]SFT29733.1 hypothetical protein SAMN02787099_04544 [Lysinibacillus fusiformis]